MIADVEKAEHAIQTIIFQEDEPDPDLLKDLDNQLEQAFTRLFAANLNTPQQQIDRIRFLLGLVDKNNEGSALLSRLTSAILADVLSISKNIDQSQQNKTQGDIVSSLAPVTSE